MCGQISAQLVIVAIGIEIETKQICSTQICDMARAVIPLIDWCALHRHGHHYVVPVLVGQAVAIESSYWPLITAFITYLCEWR